MIGTERVTSRSNKNDTAAREGEGGSELSSPDFSRDPYQSLVMKVAGKAMIFFILETGWRKTLLWANRVVESAQKPHGFYASATMHLSSNGLAVPGMCGQTN
jgi:hypothetical protein